MAKKLLVPVLPSERFYDAVVAAGDLVAERGGLVTFLFTAVRPPDDVYSDDAEGRPSLIDVALGSGELDEPDEWRTKQVAGLEEARQMLAERGVGDDQIDYLFAEYADDVSPAQAIADEAAAGAFDVVVLARGYFEEEVEEEGSAAGDIAHALQESIGDEVWLVVA